MFFVFFFTRSFDIFLSWWFSSFHSTLPHIVFGLRLCIGICICILCILRSNPAPKYKPPLRSLKFRSKHKAGGALYFGRHLVDASVSVSPSPPQVLPPHLERLDDWRLVIRKGFVPNMRAEGLPTPRPSQSTCAGSTEGSSADDYINFC